MTMLSLLGQLWYFLLAGIIISSLLSVFWSEDRVASLCQKSRRSEGVSIFIAALGGVISPIPTYAMIPLIAALSKTGAPAPALFAFLTSSPLMNPTLFFLTLGAFGSEMAVARLIVSLIVGIIAGYCMQLVISRNQFSGFIRNDSSAIWLFEPLNKTPKTISSYVVSFLEQFYRLTKFMSKYFFIGIMVAAIVKVFLPPSWILSILGKHRSMAVFIAAAAGIPLYACEGAVIPVAQVLKELGMDKGAILAFFISGPATKVSTLVALETTLTKKTFILYLIMVFGAALFFGFLYSVW